MIVNHKIARPLVVVLYWVLISQSYYYLINQLAKMFESSSGRLILDYSDRGRSGHHQKKTTTGESSKLWCTPAKWLKEHLRDSDSISDFSQPHSPSSISVAAQTFYISYVSYPGLTESILPLTMTAVMTSMCGM